AAGNGEAWTPNGPARPKVPTATSIAPHARSTMTSHGPSVAADVAPSSAYSIHRRRDGARVALGRTRSAPARTATAATAAPAPAPAPRTQRGGAAARKSA